MTSTPVWAARRECRVRLGEVYAVQALDACQHVGGLGPGAQAFRYTHRATLQIETAAHEHDFQRKIEDPHAQARGIAQVMLLLPFAALVVCRGRQIRRWGQ